MNLMIYSKAIVILLLYCVSTSCISLGYQGYVCNPRFAQQYCLMGCLSCMEYYGVQVYNLAHCCYDCQVTGARLIDNGPDKCSMKYIRDTYRLQE
ncbi:Hypothetical predicted protein [Octopus vulgaris]|uniref:Uncharacterized protein n=1 Tax=Octopus vulgaris TaxID=6645 RepID=A0AA36AHW8_OCTVU|nr:Hypothetical predicted protein [Octopus vulgaris]